MYTAFQHDKRSGITYAYEVVSYRDPVTKKPKSKRTLKGRVDPVTNEIIPTDGRCRHRSPKANEKKEESPADVLEKEPLPKTMKELKNELLRLREENQILKKKLEEIEART